MQRARHDREERDAHDVHHGRVAGEEARQIGGLRELRGRAVEHEVVGELARQGGEHLVAEDERHEPGRQQPTDAGSRVGVLVRPSDGRGRRGPGSTAEERGIPDAGRPGRVRRRPPARVPSPSNRPSVRPSRSTSGAASRPPTTAPTGKPAMIRGKLALMPAMSRIRPPAPPMNTKPSWMRTGNSTSRGADTHAARPPTATTQAPRRTTTARRGARRRRCARGRSGWALRAIARGHRAPAAPMTM